MSKKASKNASKISSKSKKPKEKDLLKKNIDPFTSANDIQNAIIDKKKGKRSPTEKKRFDRQQQKEIVRQLTTELIKISTKDALEENSKDNDEKKHTNEVIYTIKPVNYED